jgi:hypothetical protein
MIKYKKKCIRWKLLFTGFSVLQLDQDFCFVSAWTVVSVEQEAQDLIWVLDPENEDITILRNVSHFF